MLTYYTLIYYYMLIYYLCTNIELHLFNHVEFNYGQKYCDLRSWTQQYRIYYIAGLYNNSSQAITLVV